MASRRNDAEGDWRAAHDGRVSDERWWNLASGDGPCASSDARGFHFRPGESLTWRETSYGMRPALRRTCSRQPGPNDSISSSATQQTACLPLHRSRAPDVLFEPKLCRSFSWVGVSPTSRFAAESMAFRWAESKHRFGIPPQSPRLVISPANRIVEYQAFPDSFTKKSSTVRTWDVTLASALPASCAARWNDGGRRDVCGCGRGMGVRLCTD